MRNELQIQVERQQQCSVIRCTGRLLLERGLDQLEDISLNELADGQRVILDLEGVTQIDARGIGALARLSQIGLLHYHPIVIVGADARARRLLEVTRLSLVVRNVDAVSANAKCATAASLCDNTSIARAAQRRPENLQLHPSR